MIKKIINNLFFKQEIADKNSQVGINTYIGKGGAITKSTIGNYCTIANNVFIGQGEHDYTKVALSGQLYDFDSYEMFTKKECIIGNGVWIGVGSVIMRGVKVGDGAVIGANSVVTKNVPPYAIVVGTPARIIKYRFSDEKINTINKSKWWLFKLKEAKSIIASLELELNND